MIASLRRIAGMPQRYWRLLVSSWPRVLELVYWPMMQILVWGTLQIYLSEQFSNFAQFRGTAWSACFYPFWCADSSACPSPFSKRCGRTTSAIC